MRDKLIELIDRLDELDDSDRFNPLTIFAEGGPEADPEDLALVCANDEAGGLICPQDPSLSYLLEVSLAKDAIRVWSAWREAKIPSPREKRDAVLYYARHHAFLPL